MMGGANSKVSMHACSHSDAPKDNCVVCDESMDAGTASMQQCMSTELLLVPLTPSPDVVLHSNSAHMSFAHEFAIQIWQSKCVWHAGASLIN
jgi:hypothetical protein